LARNACTHVVQVITNLPVCRCGPCQQQTRALLGIKQLQRGM
jgi:hypothetical protein